MGEFLTQYKQRIKEENGTFDLQCFTKWVPQPVPITKQFVVKNIDNSLSRMRTNCLDLVQFHWWDYKDRGYLDALKYMTELVKEGKIKHLAVRYTLICSAIN